MMTELTINKFYKIFSLVTLLTGITFLFIPNGQVISEKLGPAIGINLAFHILFQFLSRAPYGLTQIIDKEHPMSNLAIKLMKGFSIALIVLPIIGTVGLISSIIIEYYYERLIVLTIFASIVLAGLALKLKLENK